MNKEQFKRIYRIAVSVMLVIAGLCLMVQCVSIYRSGDRPFSREAVAAHFAPIALPVYLCIAMAALGFILELLLPTKAGKIVPGKQYPLILQRLQEKRTLEGCEASLCAAISAQQKKRNNLIRIRTVLVILCAVIFLVYGCNGANFDQMEINSSMIRAMYVLLPCCAVPFFWTIYAARQNQASLQAEIALWKQAPLATALSTSPAPAANHAGVIRKVLLLAGICLMVYGFLTGGANDVLTKAINICTECVGLG